MKKTIIALLLLVVLVTPALGFAQVTEEQGAADVNVALQLQLNLISALQRLVALLQAALLAQQVQINTIDEKVQQIPVPVVIEPERVDETATSSIVQPEDVQRHIDAMNHCMAVSTIANCVGMAQP